MIGIIILFFYGFCMLLFIASIGLLFTPYYYYFVAALILSLMVYLSVTVAFYRYTNRITNRLKDVLLLFSANSMAKRFSDEHIIIFEKKEGEWICQSDPSIILNLNGYLFEKSFILAWIIRNLRYRTISDRQPLKRIYSFQHPIKRFKKVMVRFIDKGKPFDYIIVKNGVSRHTILTRAITKARFCLDLSGRYSATRFKDVESINEKQYLAETTVLFGKDGAFSKMFRH